MVPSTCPSNLTFGGRSAAVQLPGPVEVRLSEHQELDRRKGSGQFNEQPRPLDRVQASKKDHARRVALGDRPVDRVHDVRQERAIGVLAAVRALYSRGKRGRRCPEQDGHTGTNARRDELHERSAVERRDPLRLRAVAQQTKAAYPCVNRRRLRIPHPHENGYTIEDIQDRAIPGPEVHRQEQVRLAAGQRARRGPSVDRKT